MKTIIQTAAILPLLATLATAGSLTCQTELGSTKVNHVRTSTETKTGVQPTKTVDVRSTVTKYAGYLYTYTKFTTDTHTVTDSTVTDTYSSTTTVYSVETDTATSTITNTETDTATSYTTSTTVIPTTAGFMNIQDTINTNSLKRRAFAHPHAPRAAAKKASSVDGLAAAIYPTLVDCTTVVPNTHTKTVSKSLSPVTTSVAKFAYSTHKTITIPTTTTLVPPDVTSTVTSTSTSSVTTTTTTITTQTETTTITSTSILPGPTVFNACNNANLFGADFTSGGTGYFADNVANNGPGVASDFKTIANGASSAMDCCYACMQSGTCENFLFRATNKNCFLLYHGGETCPSQSNHPNIILSREGSDTGAGYVVGNGNCGYAYSGNSDGTVFPVD